VTPRTVRRAPAEATGVIAAGVHGAALGLSHLRSLTS
jgi:hypothetical protein